MTITFTFVEMFDLNTDILITFDIELVLAFE